MAELQNDGNLRNCFSFEFRHYCESMSLLWGQAANTPKSQSIHHSSLSSLLTAHGPCYFRLKKAYTSKACTGLLHVGKRGGSLPTCQGAIYQAEALCHLNEELNEHPDSSGFLFNKLKVYHITLSNYPKYLWYVFMYIHMYVCVYSLTAQVVWQHEKGPFDCP